MKHVKQSVNVAKFTKCEIRVGTNSLRNSTLSFSILFFMKIQLDNHEKFAAFPISSSYEYRILQQHLLGVMMAEKVRKNVHCAESH